jgi:anti-sigma B factor antagonist
MLNCVEITIKTMPRARSADEGETVVVALAGDLDGSTAPVAQQHILPQATAGSTIILDLTAVPYMSSAGLRMLLLLHRHITGHGGRVALVGVAEAVQDTMAITGFLRFYTLYPTVEAALAGLAG